MSRFQKAIERLRSQPKDFNWRELQTIMIHLGYHQVRGSGSRRKFVHETHAAPLVLHQPHPDGILKRYAVKEVINHLVKYDGLWKSY
jgi:predicted RNA binding protein YcfA (HicA-like mRNA interferase family)